MSVVFSNAGGICPVTTGAKNSQTRKICINSNSCEIPVQRYIFSFLL